MATPRKPATRGTAKAPAAKPSTAKSSAAKATSGRVPIAKAAKAAPKREVAELGDIRGVDPGDPKIEEPRIVDPRVGEPMLPAPGRDLPPIIRDQPAEVLLAASPARAAIDAAFLERAELRRGLTENLKALRTDGVVVAKRVSDAFSAWSPVSISTDTVEGRTYVAPDADPGPALDAAIERRVAAVNEAAPHTRMTVRKGFAGGGKLKLGVLVDHIGARSDALVAFESTPAVAACVAEAAATDIVAAVDAAAPAPAAGTPTPNGTADPADVDELVERAVNRQMRTASAPEDRLVFGRIPGDHDDPTQAALMDTFELRPGASDVTSYHDFNTLQIAFEHVWTKIFDGEIESLGRELYTEYVGLKDFLGDDSPDTSVSTIDDLRRLMGEIQSLSQIAQVELPPSLTGTAGTVQPPATSGGSGTLDDTVRVVGAVATGGVSAVIEWAIREFANIGKKPVLTWDQLNGGKLARGDRITARIEQGVAPAGLVELVLETDSNSKVKLFSLQTYVEQAGKFSNVVFVDNRAMNVISRGGVSYFTSSSVAASSLLATGMIEFASEQTSAIDTPGRYCLGKLGDRLRDRSRVTFYWQDF